MAGKKGSGFLQGAVNRITVFAHYVLLLAVPAALYAFEVVPVQSIAVVSLLSVLGVLFEIVLLVNSFSQRGNSAPRGRQLGRTKSTDLASANFFPLRLLMLYMLQFWFLTAELHMTHKVAPASNEAPPHPLMVPSRLQPKRVLETPVHKAQASDLLAEKVFEAHAPKKQASAPLPGSLPPPLASQVASVAHDFTLDAAPAALRWSPKSVSVVLPCAEERDFALKTVQSVFQNTPSELLHEIVVVDDGSKPPLSQTHLSADVQAQYKVRVLRHEETVGLIGAKKTGGDSATGDIVVFFDCHVAPQPNWEKDFFSLISENYRRVVVPQITALNIDTWQQLDGGGGMSQCYVTWDGDFKWGGTDDMYMGMLSGGLLGMSKRWWDETGGYDDQMLGWGGENIDQGIRTWVCGGEIVSAPNAMVAHMWRVDGKTKAHYKHVGDTTKNRGRAVTAWFGDFAKKLEDFPQFASRKRSSEGWLGDMSNFQKVKDRLQGCRPFAWYLRRFKAVYEDAGIIPSEIFMLREAQTGKCLLFQGPAGTSGDGREGVVLAACDAKNHRFFWHVGNRHESTRTCCSGLRAWNSDQCFEGGQPNGKAITGVCDISGESASQRWSLHSDGSLRTGSTCMGLTADKHGIEASPCISFRARGGDKFTKESVTVPLERLLYDQAPLDHPEMFEKLNEHFAAESKAPSGPAACKQGDCIVLSPDDSSGRCVDGEGGLTDDGATCTPLIRVGLTIRSALKNGQCLDRWSDDDAETWGFYNCHGGGPQQFTSEGKKVCAAEAASECFISEQWH